MKFDIVRVQTLRAVFRLVPESRFWGFKRLLLRLQGVEVGPGVRVISSVKIRVGTLSIGPDSFIGHEVLFVGGLMSEIKIGSRVDIAPRVVFAAGSHEIGDGRRLQGMGQR